MIFLSVATLFFVLTTERMAAWCLHTILCNIAGQNVKEYVIVTMDISKPIMMKGKNPDDQIHLNRYKQH